MIVRRRAAPEHAALSPRLRGVERCTELPGTGEYPGPFLSATNSCLCHKEARSKNRTSIRPKKRRTSSPDKPDSQSFTTTYAGIGKGRLVAMPDESDEERIVEYGPRLPTLVKLLEERYFA